MRPLKVYIDNCSLNDIAPKGTIWEETVLGKYLQAKTLSGDVEVFASPAGAIEIALNKDLAQRNNMAKALNTLIRGQRMMASKEFYIIEDFLHLVEATWASTTKLERLELLKANSARIYIALLGQLAALKDYDCSKGFSGVIVPKLATQILHSKIFENPKKEIEERIDAINKKKYSPLSYFTGLEALGIEELQKQEEEYGSRTYTIDKNIIKLLQRNQDLLINGYSLDELSFAASQVFYYWEDLNTTIVDFSAIVNNWSNKSPIEKEDNMSIIPLNEDVIDRLKRKVMTIEDCRYLLKAMVNRFHSQTTFTKISNYIIIKDLEKALNSGKIPSGGIVLDSSHCIAAMYVEILLSRDQRLNTSVDYWYSQIRNKANLFRETVKNINELQRQVEKGLKHNLS